MGYITIYNNIQSLLWGIGLLIVISSLVFDELKLYLNKYYIVIQSFMILDIIHVLLKIIRSNLVTTLLQVSSRLYVIWAILPFQKASTIFNYFMFIAWSLAEIIRYQYYNHKDNKGFLLFARYNAFILLYPLGVCGGEIPLIYQNWVTTGNKFQLFVIALYVPFFPYLFYHMLVLRKKNLQNSKKD